MKRIYYIKSTEHKFPQWQQCLAFAWERRSEYPFKIACEYTILRALENRGLGFVVRRRRPKIRSWAEVTLNKYGWMAARRYYEQIKNAHESQ